MEVQQRSPLLSARINWIVLEIFILFIVTNIYTVLIWLDTSGSSSQTNFETFKIVVKEVLPFSGLAMLYIVSIFEIGGEIMLRYTAKIQQALAEGKAEGIAEGEAKGKAEGIAEGEAKERELWTEWNKRRLEAEAKGEAFTEDPPA